LRVGLGVGDLGVVSTDSSSVGVRLGLFGFMSSVVSSFLLVLGVHSGLSGIFLSDLLSSNLVLGFGFLELGGGMGLSGCLNGVYSSIVNLGGFMHFFLGSLEGSFSFKKSLFGMLNFTLSVTYSSMGFSLSLARESLGFDSGSENSSLGSGFSLGKFVIRSSLFMGSLGFLVSGNLGFEGSIEVSFSTSSRQSSLFSTEVNFGLFRSDFIESFLLSYVLFTGGLSVVEGVESIEERKISKNSSGVSGLCFLNLLANVRSFGPIIVSTVYIVPLTALGVHLDTVFTTTMIIRLISSPVGIGKRLGGFSLPDVMTFLSMVVKADPSRSFDVTLNGIILSCVLRMSEVSFLCGAACFSFFPVRVIDEEFVFYSSSFPLSCGLCLILKVESFSISGKGGDDGEFGVHI